MSTEVVYDSELGAGAAELTPLGKQLEIMRIERGVSKQRLARQAGTSRQQLWRVMTGKSELTNSLRERLASALAVSPATLDGVHGSTASTTTSRGSSGGAFTVATVSDYLTNATHVVATLRTLPTGDGGRRLKRALLNAVEDLAVEAGTALPLDYSEIRRRVLAGEL